MMCFGRSKSRATEMAGGESARVRVRRMSSASTIYSHGDMGARFGEEIPASIPNTPLRWMREPPSHAKSPMSCRIVRVVEMGAV